MCSDGRRNLSVVAQWKVNPKHHVTGVYTKACACAAFGRAEDATKGPVPPGGYRHYYYNNKDDLVCSTGSSCEGKEDPLNPPVDVNEDDWVTRYYEHIWCRAAGQVSTIPRITRGQQNPQSF